MNKIFNKKNFLIIVFLIMLVINYLFISNSYSKSNLVFGVRLSEELSGAHEEWVNSSPFLSPLGMSLVPFLSTLGISFGYAIIAFIICNSKKLVLCRKNVLIISLSIVEIIALQVINIMSNVMH